MVEVECDGVELFYVCEEFSYVIVRFDLRYVWIEIKFKFGYEFFCYCLLVYVWIC